MTHGEVLGHAMIACSSCEHPNDPNAEWCEVCLAEVEPVRRRSRRLTRLSTRVFTRPVPRRDEALT